MEAVAERIMEGVNRQLAETFVAVVTTDSFQLYLAEQSRQEMNSRSEGVCYCDVCGYDAGTCPFEQE